MKQACLLLFAFAIATPAVAQGVISSATAPAASAAGEKSASGSGGGGSSRDVHRRMSKHRHHRM